MAAPTREWPGLPVLDTPVQPVQGIAWRLWACAERIAAAASLVILAPVLTGLGVAVALVSRQSPLVAHRRIGWKGETLWLVKFRTMWDDSGHTPTEPFQLMSRLWNTQVPSDKSVDDPRVTHPLARWMRRFSFDELPQLIHVVTGRMALAGPRPLTYEELAQHYKEATPVVLSVKPGITGLWQVRGRNALSYPKRRRLDLFLVRKFSLGLYCRILWWTLPAVFRGENAR